MARVLFESCVDSLEAAVASAEGGAGRLEVCANLDVGGTTPDPALVAAVAAAVRIPVVAMVRPRGGDFVYDAREVAAMERDIAALRAAGAHGLALGVLRSDRTIDANRMARFVALAQPLPITCHKAFDDTPDLVAALDVLRRVGVQRVLTSGGTATANAGSDVIADLVRRAGHDLTVIAAGHVRADGVHALIAVTGVREVHARIIREPAPADAATRQRWRGDIAAVVAAVAEAGAAST